MLQNLIHPDCLLPSVVITVNSQFCCVKAPFFTTPFAVPHDDAAVELRTSELFTSYCKH